MLVRSISQGVYARVAGVSAQIGDVNLGPISADERLKFGLVEHGQPRRLNDLAEAAQESIRLLELLGLKAVTSDVGDVDESIFVRDGDTGATRFQLTSNGPDGTFTLRLWAGDDIGDGEVETKVFDISRIVFQLELQWSRMSAVRTSARQVGNG